MNNQKTILKNVWPYQKDKLRLPVGNLDIALPFYRDLLGFQLVSRNDSPSRSALLERDGIQIGLAENGGDPTQDGCFFEVDNNEIARTEFKLNGLEKMSDNKKEQHGATSWEVFYVVAPDGLCFCFGERQR